MKKGIIIGLIFMAMLIIWYGLTQRNQEVPNVPDTPIEERDREKPDANDLSQASCEASGGAWNSCGSACRTEPDAVCIELCVEYCECQSDSQCPSGFSCGEFVEGVGVCL